MGAGLFEKILLLFVVVVVVNIITCIMSSS